MRWYVFMTYINPISGTAMAAAVQQEQRVVDKSRQIRRQQDLKRNVAATDSVELVVENAEAIAPVHDEAPPDRHSKQKRRNRKNEGEIPADDEGHIDVVG
jgi:hypothetical protein